MNILFYYQSASLGGQQTQILHLCQEFQEMGHRVYWVYETGNDLLELVGKSATPLHLVVSTEYSGRMQIGSTRIYQFAVKTLKRFFAIRKYIKNNNIDLIITSESYGSLICGWASSSNQQQFRLIGQDIEALEHPWYRYYKMLMIDRHVDKYFGWSTVYDSLVKKGVSRDKFACFQNNAVDVEMFHPLSVEERQSIRRSLDIDDNEIVIGWIGRLEERMQVKYTVELGYALKQMGFDGFKLLIIGGGRVTANGIEDKSYPEILRKKVMEYGITEQTIFTGWVPHNEVVKYLNAMDIVPLLEEDPMGGSILRETMACGRLAMSVDGVSGSQRQFMDPGYSVLLEPADFVQKCAEKILMLSQDIDEIERLGKKSRDYCVANLSFKGQAEDILSHV